MCSSSFLDLSLHHLCCDAFKRIGLIEFYGRRIRRLLPALAAMLVVVLAASTWFSTIAARTQTVRTGQFATFSMANLFLYRFRPDGYFEQSEKANALIHTWSLSIEEQFYLLFPLLIMFSIWIARRISRRPVATLRDLSFGVRVISLVFCIMDAAPTLCPAKTCSVYREGKWWWRDDAHLSIVASKFLIPLMTERIKVALALPLAE